MKGSSHRHGVAPGESLAIIGKLLARRKEYGAKASKEDNVAAMRSVRCLERSFLGMMLSLSTAAIAQGQWWSVQTSGVDTDLRGVSAVSVADAQGKFQVAVWASGSNGAIFRSVDSGKTWKRLDVKGASALGFRGIAARSANVAYVMSIGNGDKSRIYKTADGGATWKLQFTGARNEVFLDALVCYTDVHCFALGDPVDGKFLLLETTDGDTWQEVPRDNMPAALPNEGAFAASNSCLAVHGADLYFGTGGAATARVFHSPDFGRTWTVSDTPIASGNASSGIFSLDVNWTPWLIVVGGDYQEPTRAARSAAISRDNGKTWELSNPLPGGFRSAVSVFNDSLAVTVGPTGEDVADRGLSWKHTDALNLNAVSMIDSTNGWAVGPKGTIARFRGVRTFTDAVPSSLSRLGPQGAELPRASGSGARGTCCSLPVVAGLSTLPGLLQ
jgi:photosystem II stability/assembly factor-like uncharacterized protein